jgi:hypothetical protein
MSKTKEYEMARSRESIVKYSIATTGRKFMAGSFSVILFLLVNSLALAQETNPARYAGVENTRMGAYQALAELSYRAFEQRDIEQAAELSRILELTWDRGEGQGEQSLSKTRPEVFRKIDAAMDGFIKPILRYSTQSPDAAAVKRAYEQYLSTLRLGDEE